MPARPDAWQMKRYLQNTLLPSLVFLSQRQVSIGALEREEVDAKLWRAYLHGLCTVHALHV